MCTLPTLPLHSLFLGSWAQAMPLKSQMGIQAESKGWWLGTLGWRLVGHRVGTVAVIQDSNDNSWWGVDAVFKVAAQTGTMSDTRPRWISEHFSLLLHKVWQGSKMISLGCPKYTPKKWCFHCGLQHILGLNSSAQSLVTYFLILGHRANVTVELALPKEVRKRNGEA